MKRLAPLLLVVLALAAVPVALADGTPAPAAQQAQSQPAQSQPAQSQQHAGHPIARMRLEILRLRLQLVRLRYRVACHDASSDACSQFTQKVVAGLTKLDGNVQKKLSDLGCSSASADRRCTVLTRIDTRLQAVIAKLGGGSSSPSSTTSDSSLDSAANALGQLAGSNG